MKHSLIISLLLSLLLLCTTSCNYKSNESKTLDFIENIMHIYPDSALSILDTLVLPSNALYEQNRYFLYRIYAKDRIGKDISMDREIVDIHHYFADNKDRYHSMLAAYYAGRILQDNKDYDSAITYYNIAESYAIESNEKSFQGYILYSVGWLMLDQFLVKEFEEKLWKANSLFIETSNYEYEIKSYKLLGLYFLMAGEADSALVHYKKALNLAIRYNNKKEQATTTQNIGLAFNEKGDFRTSINTLLEAIQIDSTAHASGKVYMNLSQTYSNLGIADSARYYIHLGITKASSNEKVDYGVVATMYQILAEIEEQAGNYKEALKYDKLYSDNIIETLAENKNAAVIEADSKYRFESIRNENIALAIKNLKTQRAFFLALFVIAVLAVIYTVILLRKNRQLTKANDEILSLTNMMKGHNMEKKSYRDNLIYNLSILKRAATLEYLVHDSNNKQGKTLIRSFNEVAYGGENIDWEILYKTINSVHRGVFDDIKKKYPSLDETEFRICCLICSEFSSNEIATITQLSVNTIHTKTTSIRKKLGVERYGNIKEFLLTE